MAWRAAGGRRAGAEVGGAERRPHRQRHQPQRLRAHRRPLERREGVDEEDRPRREVGVAHRRRRGGGEVDDAGEEGGEALGVRLDRRPRRRALARLQVHQRDHRHDVRPRSGRRVDEVRPEVALEVAGEVEGGEVGVGVASACRPRRAVPQVLALHHGLDRPRSREPVLRGELSDGLLGRGRRGAGPARQLLAPGCLLCRRPTGRRAALGARAIVLRGGHQYDVVGLFIPLL